MLSLKYQELFLKHENISILIPKKKKNLHRPGKLPIAVKAVTIRKQCISANEKILTVCPFPLTEELRQRNGN